MESYKMILVMFVCVVAMTEFAMANQLNQDDKRIENLEKQLAMLTNLVHAQSNILAKFSCSASQSNNPTSECILKIADQAKNIAKLQAEIGGLDTRSKTQASQIQQLQSSTTDLSKKFISQQSKLNSVDSKFTSEVYKLRSEIRKVEQKSNSLASTVTSLGTKVQQLTGAWPSGKYCILASGPCPAGFTRRTSYMRAISLYAGSATYIKQGTFGDSKIKCHGNCGQYGHWTGELHLTTCCK